MQIGQSAAQSHWLRDIGMELHVCVGTKVEEEYLQHQERDVVELHETGTDPTQRAHGLRLNGLQESELGASWVWVA
uniref:hypothetical protein n=1 Tax=Verminephrobacter eiseniae TaxID=364317 RepID=UPI0022370259|nr:hypothetical protein [Verminephrobacter eiseniae]